MKINEIIGSEYSWNLFSSFIVSNFQFKVFGWDLVRSSLAVLSQISFCD